MSPSRPAFFKGLSTTSQRSLSVQALPSSPSLKKVDKKEQPFSESLSFHCIPEPLHFLLQSIPYTFKENYCTHRSPISSSLPIRSPLDVEKDLNPGVGMT